MRRRCGLTSNHLTAVVIYHYSRENGSSDCPTCKHALDESRLFPDNYANREIQSLTVKCPNTKLGCTAVVELRNVQVRSNKPCNIIYFWVRLSGNHAVSEADLGMSSMFGRTGAPTKMGPTRGHVPKITMLLVHIQVTIIFVVSVCLFVCLCRVFLSRLRSDLGQTRTHVTCPGLVVSPRI